MVNKDKQIGLSMQKIGIIMDHLKEDDMKDIENSLENIKQYLDIINRSRILTE